MWCVTDQGPIWSLSGPEQFEGEPEGRYTLLDSQVHSNSKVDLEWSGKSHLSIPGLSIGVPWSRDPELWWATLSQDSWAKCSSNHTHPLCKLIKVS